MGSVGHVSIHQRRCSVLINKRIKERHRRLRNHGNRRNCNHSSAFMSRDFIPSKGLFQMEEVAMVMKTMMVVAMAMKKMLMMPMKTTAMTMT